MSTATAVLPLRDYQADALDAAFREFRGDNNRALIVLPTGTGKSVVAAHAVARGGGRALLVAPRLELLHQLAEKIRLVTPELSVGLVVAGIDEHDADVVIASDATLRSEHRRNRLGTFDLIVLDEAHHASAPTWLEIMRHFGSFAGVPTLGMTATPSRLDNSLGKAFGEACYVLDVADAITRGILSDLEVRVVGTDVDLDAVGSRGGDFIESQLATAMQEANVIPVIADAITTHAPDRRGVAFLPSIALAEELAEELRNRGMAAESVNGEMPRDQRAEVLGRLRGGDTRIVTNCAILTEGFDLPELDLVVMARPTKSAGLFTQCVGRGLRKASGKENCLLLDVVGVSGTHGIVTAVSLGLATPPAAEPREPGAGSGAAPGPQLTLARYSGTVTLTSNLRWIPLQEERAYALPVRKRVYALLVEEQPDEWTVLAASSEMGTAGIWDLAGGMTLDDARALAEARVGPAARRLAAADAQWLAKPVSDAQRRALARFGIPVPGTSGEASSALSAHEAARFVTQYRISGSTAQGVAA